MSSRYLRSLESTLAGPLDEELRAELTARKAFHYARLGKSSQVSELAAEVRQSQQKASSTSGRAICWINLAEGIVRHYEGDVDAARSKFQRARAVAESLASRDICAVASAWLAFSYYLSEQLGPMLESGIAAIKKTDAANYSAISRQSLTIALCRHYIGEPVLARDWYTKTRLAALNDGDEATIAALIHSMAWMRVSTMRSRSDRALEGMVAESDLLIVKAESVQSYEELVEAKSLPNLTPLLQAQELLVESHFEAALALLDEYAVELRSQGFQRLEIGLQADRAYCLAKLGRAADATRIAQQVCDSKNDTLHSDDLFIFHSTLQKTFHQLSSATECRKHEGEAAAAFEKMVRFKGQMKMVVNDMIEEARNNSAYA